MTMRSFRVFFQSLSAVAVLWLGTATPARADLIISGIDQTVAVGGTAEVSFYITSTGSDQLGSFNLQSQITGAAGQLAFSPSQSASFVNANNYVFSNNSLDANVPPFWGSPFSTAYANDTVTGFDNYTGGTGAATVSSSQTFLLATVTVDATNPNLVAAGESFQISLVPTSIGDPNATNFQDAAGNLINYTSASVTVNVVPAEVSAVPAPSSLVLAGIAAPIGLLYYWRRRTTAASP